MTPVTLMPSAPPSRPVTPAGGGVPDTSSSSFESALQRAGADDDTPTFETPDAKPVARQASDKPAARSSSTTSAKRPQDDKAASREDDRSTDGDSTTATPNRTRQSSAHDGRSEKRESKDSSRISSGDAQAMAEAVPVSVQIPVLAVVAPAADVAKADGSIKSAVLRPADEQVQLPKTKGQTKDSKVVNVDARNALSAAAERDDAVDSDGQSFDVADVKQPSSTHTMMQPSHVARPEATKLLSSQAARTMLADALRRASTPGSQSPEASQGTQSAARVTRGPGAATAIVPASAPAARGAENAPVAKSAGKAQTPAPSAQDVAVPALGATQHEGDSAGNGGTSTGSGRREVAPTPHAKADTSVAWPTAFAVRVPEAMSSSLERTGSATPTLPSTVTQQDLSNVGPQLVRGVQLQATAGGGDVKMTLNPEHLGSVTIEVQVRNDRVSAALTAETPEVRQWIATHQADLKNSLAGVGLTLDDLVVKDEGGGGRQDARGDEQQSPSRRRQPATEQDEMQFEVLV